MAFRPSAVRYRSKQWSSKMDISRKIQRKSTILKFRTDIFVFSRFSDCTIESQYQPDLKTSFPSVFIHFKLIFQIWVLRIFTNPKFVILLGHCFELYPAAEGRNVIENARFVRFAQNRYFKNLKLSKNIKFRESYSWWMMRWTILQVLEVNPI